MTAYLDTFKSLLLDHGFSADWAEFLTQLAGITALVLLAFVANFIAKRVILRAVRAIIARTPTDWDNIMNEAGVFSRLSHLAPALVFTRLGAQALQAYPKSLLFLENLVNIYLIVIGLMVFSAFLNGVDILIRRGNKNKIPIKGFIQAVKLVAYLVTTIFILAILLDRSPLYFFSGLGAVMAILILVFRDALLGFVAGIQISVNQMVRIGDWIEMPKAGADGDVIDVSLTTVKVSNWDRTITTIPTYSLISESFKNWRGMQESGGRRIKRSIQIDLRTIAFASEEQLARWQQFRLLQPYLDAKLKEIAAENTTRGEDDLGALGNGRRLTNLGTFRAYCIAYLKAHSKVHQEMIQLVRQLQPTEHGIPLEIYVFTNDIRWGAYESIQADIFDHLFSIIDQFGLRVFQDPSGNDLQAALASLPASPSSPPA